MGEPLVDDQAASRDAQEKAEARAFAAIAHELKNPLQSLRNLLYLIGNYPSDVSVGEWATQAQREVNRISQITSGLLEASRALISREEVELCRIVEDSLASFQEKIQYKQITVRKRLECRGIVQSTAAEVRHIVDNVLVNALEAVSSGGVLMLHLLDSVDWQAPGRRGCRLVVFDNGPGIPQQQCKRIFEPFFTTKLGKGTGIGLWVVNRLVRKYDGSLRVASRVGGPRQGTAFSVFLPAAAPNPAAAPSGPGAQPEGKADRSQDMPPGIQGPEPGMVPGES